MVKERNYENLDFSWDELYAEVHSIFKKKIEKLKTIVIPEESDTNDQLSFRLIDGKYCYTEVDSNVLIKSLLNMTYRSQLDSVVELKKFERLMEKYGITTQEVNYFFDTNASNMIIYAVENLLFICKFVSRDTVLEIIKNLLSDKLFSSKAFFKMAICVLLDSLKAFKKALVKSIAKSSLTWMPLLPTA